MIQRYTFGVLKPDRDAQSGEYVLFSDHVAELKELQARLERLERHVQTLEGYFPRGALQQTERPHSYDDGTVGTEAF